MNSVIVCHGCGRTIDSEFLYCPWCSLSRVTSDGSLSIAGVFDRLNRMQESTRGMQISELERKLDEIEKGLDEFAAPPAATPAAQDKSIKGRKAAVAVCE